MSTLFNPIGDKVDKVAPAAIQNGQNGVAAPEEDEKVVDEIASLCMHCGENVSLVLLDATDSKFPANAHC